MHLGFRRMQTVLLTETRGFIDRGRDPVAFARSLGGVAGQFLNGLHGHHHIEDDYYFPILKGLDARIASGFDLLDADHQAMDGAIHELAEAANAVLLAVKERAPAEAAAGALLGRLAAFERLLDRHLTDEEELVVPVILDHPEAGLG
jgi:iron-sulfur cluster repair protein YtfE (RIC family)